MKLTPFKINIFLLIWSTLVVLSCTKEDCFDVEQLDEYTAETISWFVADSINDYRTFVDANEISQTLVTSMKSSIYSEDTSEDDCGNTYGSHSFSIQYNPSLMELHFMVDIKTGVENDFRLKLMVNNIHNEVQGKSAEYNFVSKSCTDNHAEIDILETLMIQGREIKDVMKIRFKENISTDDVAIVYYAKGLGIVKFTQSNGNTFELE